jgi:hypothetical protein
VEVKADFVFALGEGRGASLSYHREPITNAGNVGPEKPKIPKPFFYDGVTSNTLALFFSS